MKKFFVSILSFCMLVMFSHQAHALLFGELLSGQGKVLGEAISSDYKFYSGSLVNDSGAIYFISGSQKIPFNNMKVFKELGYSTKYVVKGDLANYTLSETTISTSKTAHPLGSWLKYKGKIYYSDASGLVRVPTTAILVANKGAAKYVVNANSFDAAILKQHPNLPPLVKNDERIFNLYVPKPSPVLPFAGNSGQTSNQNVNSSAGQTFSTTTLTSNLSSINLSSSIGANAISQLTLTNNYNGGAVTWSVVPSSTSTWVSVSPSGGTINPGGTQNITVTANTSALNFGANNDNINISYVFSTGVTGTLNIPVTVNISNAGSLANLALAQSSMDIYYTIGGNLPTATSVGLSNLSASAFASYTPTVALKPAWLNCSYPTTASTLAPSQSTGICVATDPSYLTVPQTYTSYIQIAGNFLNSPLVLKINLIVSYPTAYLSKNILNFSSAAGAAPPDQTADLQFSPAKGFSWTVSITYNSGENWLSVYNGSTQLALTNTPAQAGAATLKFVVDKNVLSPGDYSATVVISSAASPIQFNPITLPITLTVQP